MIYSFNDEEWLNQLSAIKLGLRAKVAQVLRSSESHQTLHHRDISSSHRAKSEPGAVATGYRLITNTFLLAIVRDQKRHAAQRRVSARFAPCCRDRKSGSSPCAKGSETRHAQSSTRSSKR